MGDGNETGPVAELGGNGRDGQSASGGRIEVGVPPLDAAGPRRDHPGPNVGVMIEAGDDDLVTRIPRFRYRPTDGKGEAGHVLPEHDLLRNRRVQQVRYRAPRRSHHRDGIRAGLEVPADVADSTAQHAAHRGDDVLGNLSAPRAVDVHRGSAVDLPAQRGKTGPDTVGIQGDGEISGSGSPR